MTSSSAASLLVAALAVLARPCPRNTAVARLLMRRASRHDALSPAERETCRALADAMEESPDGWGLVPEAIAHARLVTNPEEPRRQSLPVRPRAWTDIRIHA